MKKTLVLCSILFFLMAAMTTTVFGNSENSQETDNTASETIVSGSTSLPTQSTSQALPMPLQAFGHSIGIYRFRWEFELDRIRSEEIATDNEDYINYLSPDCSLLFDFKLPYSDEVFQLKVGLNIHRSNGHWTPDASTTQQTTVQLPTTTIVLPSTQPSVTTVITVVPTTHPSTTQRPTTVTTTTVVPTTQTTVTQAPITQATTAQNTTTHTPTTAAPVTQAPVTTEQNTGTGAIPKTVPAMEYTQEELDLLARIIYCEAGGEPFEGQIAVGSVVLNRVASSKFPNSIHDVIYQKGQFSPAYSGKLYKKSPTASCYEAARRCLEGERTDTRILYFRASQNAPKNWMNGKRKLIVVIGNQNFYS